MAYEYIPFYISTPCQVKYFDDKTATYKGGIAYKDELIMSDSTVVNVDSYALSISKQFNIEPDDVIITLDWLDLSNAILNG